MHARTFSQARRTARHKGNLPVSLDVRTFPLTLNSVERLMSGITSGAASRGMVANGPDWGRASTSMTLLDYYAVLGLEAQASAAEIKKAYQRASLQSHPDRYPHATPEEKRDLTERFQRVADAYYILSDAERRAEYDAMRASGQTSFDGWDARPAADRQFADVWADLLRPEMERQTSVWRTSGTLSGAVLGYIVANLPGAIGGALLGHGLGAVRDAKGQSVSQVFLSLPLDARASVLRAVAAKVLASM